MMQDDKRETRKTENVGLTKRLHLLFEITNFLSAIGIQRNGESPS